MEHIRSGKLRALAVTVGKRWFALPDVPTVAETVPGFETSLWYGIVAPKGTPPDVINKLNQAVTAVLADSKVVARLAELGGEPMPMSPKEFAKLIVDDTEKWAKVIKAASIKID
jgi:tripartite-type tricarboxylate transporter receptor subunit TctC